MKRINRNSLFEKVACYRISVSDLCEGLKFYRDNLRLRVIWKTNTTIGFGINDNVEIVIHNERESGGRYNG